MFCVFGKTRCSSPAERRPRQRYPYSDLGSPPRSALDRGVPAFFRGKIRDIVQTTAVCPLACMGHIETAAVILNCQNNLGEVIVQ
jgi:hypothetical protein